MSLEKVQVSVLADRVNDLLDAHAEGTATEPLGEGDTDPLITPIEDEFRVDTLALAWDPERLVLVIECHDQDPEEVEGDGADGLSTLRVVLDAAGGTGLRPALRQGRSPPVAPRARSAASRSTPPATSAPVPTDTGAELEELLSRGDLTPVGRISGSSNGALLCLVGDPADEVLVIHKPEAAERRLWDYPDGTLVARERAAYLVSEAGGFGVVPTTVLRDGPLGAGSVQRWVGPLTDDVDDPLVDVVAPDEVPEGWLVVLEGETPLGEEVVVAHSGEPALRTVAVLDAALNNSDRKGSHLLRDGDVVRGCDHGVSLGVEPEAADRPLGLGRGADPRRGPRPAGAAGGGAGRLAGGRPRPAPHRRRGRGAGPPGRRAAAPRPTPRAPPGLAGDPVAGTVTHAP